MKASEILNQLTQQGVQFWVKDDKLNIRSPQGIITPEIQTEISKHKVEIIELLQQNQHNHLSAKESEKDDQKTLVQGVNLATIGKLISGFSEKSYLEYQTPIINPNLMAKNLKVTFRPLPDNYDNLTIIEFREKLLALFYKYGVNIIPWEQAQIEIKHQIKIPIINIKKTITIKSVHSHIDAVIDVERPNSLWRKWGIIIAENWYKLSYNWLKENQKLSVVHIAKLSTWAEDHAAKYVEDPTNTQVVMITNLDHKFVNSDIPYSEKINIGINTLIRTFAEIVIGVSSEKISILNMNLCDANFQQQQIKAFVLKSLIPKIFVPISPLLINRFQLGEYNPQLSEYASKLVKLGQELVSTGLFPPGFKLAEIIQRKSHQDIINIIVNGRTGVSYGFVAYSEPPQYIGKPEITAEEWQNLLNIPGFNSEEIRQNQEKRRYLKTTINGEIRFKQIPDIWLVSSRSGANKTNLDLNHDILRIGLTDRLHLQLPSGTDLNKVDIKPSYDIYVMFGISLAAAIYSPELVKNGAAIVHFHGYPHINWFRKDEYYTGVDNPSVPCGTYESGVFNFLGIANLEPEKRENINLLTLIEPDHGTNIISNDWESLVNRLKSGCDTKQIELGGKHFSSLIGARSQ